MENNSSGGLLAVGNNLSSRQVMQDSNTSIGFKFDDKTKHIDKDILQQVSLMYLNNHSGHNNESEISLSIR